MKALLCGGACAFFTVFVLITAWSVADWVARGPELFETPASVRAMYVCAAAFLLAVCLAVLSLMIDD